MARVLKANAASVLSCAGALKSGKVIVYPTETVYGLGADATNRQAVRRLFEIKARNPKKPISIALPDIDSAMEFAEFNDVALVLAKKFTPGPITLVLNAKKPLPLITQSGKIGIRIPSNAFAMKLLREFRKPITATSANISGFGSAAAASDVDTRVWEKVEIVVNDLRTQYGKESTVVEITGRKPKILREGAIKRTEIENILKTKTA